MIRQFTSAEIHGTHVLHFLLTQINTILTVFTSVHLIVVILVTGKEHACVNVVKYCNVHIMCVRVISYTFLHHSKSCQKGSITYGNICLPHPIVFVNCSTLCWTVHTVH